MSAKIAFVGGIHGVGKSTICKEICNKLNLDYLSASDLIEWSEINRDLQNKRVEDIPFTQDRLIVGLVKTVRANKSYLLDGHYCLLNGQSDIVNVPLGIFQEIGALSLNLILGDVSEIKSRLEERDKKSYDYDLLHLMQESELNHAQYLSNVLKVPLEIGGWNNYSNLLTSISKAFTTI